MPDDPISSVPVSFLALYLAAGRLKPSASRADIAERHEFCDDLSAVLAEHAGAIHGVQGVAEDEVLRRMHRGLREPASGVSAREAEWVVRRLAERLSWAMPAADVFRSSSDDES
jgi:hypothetical protein